MFMFFNNILQFNYKDKICKSLITFCPSFWFVDISGKRCDVTLEILCTLREWHVYSIKQMTAQHTQSW